MEPRNREKFSEASSEGRTSPPRQEQKPRRFQIVKLEERIAPSNGNAAGHYKGVLSGPGDPPTGGL